MGTVIVRLLRYIPIALKYAVQVVPLLYEGSVWAIKIVKEWRKKKPEKKDTSGASRVEPLVDAKPDPG